MNILLGLYAVAAVAPKLIGRINERGEVELLDRNARIYIDAYRRPKHIPVNVSVAEYEDDFFSRIESAMELHPKIPQTETRWDVPQEPQERFGEKFWEGVNRFVGIPFPKVDFAKLSTPPHITGIGLTFIQIFPDSSALRKLCRQVRNTTLEVLRNVVAMEFYMSQEKELHLDTVVVKKYRSFVSEKLLVPLMTLEADMSQNFAITTDDIYNRSMNLLQLNQLNQTRVLWSNFVQEGLKTYKDWIAIIYHTKNTLRYVGDRLTFALNEAPYWSCMVRFGCYTRRKRIIVKRR